MCKDGRFIPGKCKAMTSQKHIFTDLESDMWWLFIRVNLNMTSPTRPFPRDGTLSCENPIAWENFFFRVSNVLMKSMSGVHVCLLPTILLFSIINQPLYVTSFGHESSLRIGFRLTEDFKHFSRVWTFFTRLRSNRFTTGISPLCYFRKQSY